MSEDSLNINQFKGKTISSIEEITHKNGKWLDIDFTDGSVLSMKLHDDKADRLLMLVEEWIRKTR